jgi:WD40 repeat protein
VYAGSKDCRISAWDTATMAAAAPIPVAAASASTGSSSLSTGPVAKRPRKGDDDGDDEEATEDIVRDEEDDDHAAADGGGSKKGGGRRSSSSSSAAAHSSSSSSSFPSIAHVFYPGRQRTRIDTEAQEEVSERAQEGKFEPSSSSTKHKDDKTKKNVASASSSLIPLIGDKSSWTGLRSVIGLGYGGGRIGSTHEIATALRPAQQDTHKGSKSGGVGVEAVAAAAAAAGDEEDEDEGTEKGVGIAAALTAAGAKAAQVAVAAAASSSSSYSSAGASSSSSVLSKSSLLMTGPRIIHGQDGVSSIVIPGNTDGKQKQKEGGATDADMSTSEKNAAANRAAVARLRTVPDYRIVGHYEPIYCLALSSDGKYLVSGGKDRTVRVWDPNAATNTSAMVTALKQKGKDDGSATNGSSGLSLLGPGLNIDNFVGHKDSITALSFRKNSHTLYSASSDRCIKVWSLDEMSYNDTLFGHQSDITALSSLYKDGRCISSGGRDRTVRLWKINEQSHLIFRCHTTDVSTDAVAYLNDSWFISGGSDGSLSLWHSGKKKPVYTRYKAHSVPVASTAAGAGGDDDDSSLAAVNPVAPVPFSSWITAIAHCPSTDVIATGSGDGYVRLWRLVTEQEVQASQEEEEDSEDDEEDDSDEDEEGDSAAADPALVAEKKRLKELRKRAKRLQRAVNLSGLEANKGTAFKGIVALTAVPVRGIVNGLSFSADGRILACAVGQEHRLGGWFKDKKARNGVLFVKMPDWRQTAAPASAETKTKKAASSSSAASGGKKAPAKKSVVAAGAGGAGVKKAK